MAKNKKINKNKGMNPWLKVIVVIISMICLALTFIVGETITNSNKQLISLIVIPLILGIVFEQKRLNRSWKEIGFKLLGAYCFSMLIGFLPGRHEKVYSFEHHIELFPFLFTFIFLMISWGIESEERENKLISKISEAILLLQSISIIYLLFDFHFFEDLNIFKFIILIIVAAFALFSFSHSFLYIEHTRFSKLYLSVWSSVIMAVFGIYYCIRVFKYDFSSEFALSENLISFIQYFLLGVSSIYIFQNLWMLLRFLPSKNESGKEYKKELKKLKETHIERFSDSQVPIFSSLFCLIFVVGIYFLNYIYNWIPSYTMIWLVFTFFPFIIFYWEKLIYKNSIYENPH